MSSITRSSIIQRTIVTLRTSLEPRISKIRRSVDRRLEGLLHFRILRFRWAKSVVWRPSKVESPANQIHQKNFRAFRQLPSSKLKIPETPKETKEKGPCSSTHLQVKVNQSLKRPRASRKKKKYWRTKGTRRLMRMSQLITNRKKRLKKRVKKEYTPSTIRF